MSRTRRLSGDWQTPLPLARAVCRRLLDANCAPASVLEPTCGVGAFLVAASEVWPGADLIGLDRNSEHLDAARAALPQAHFEASDAFAEDWRARLAGLPGPVLLLGNPPWVSASSAGARGSRTGAPRSGFVSGLDTVTGASDFDVAEWLLRQWLAAASGLDVTVAMLVKTHVARRLLDARVGEPIGLWRINANRHFGVRVEAALLVVRPGETTVPCPVHPSLDAQPDAHWGRLDGALVRDLPAALSTRHLMGAGGDWRSGVKHDAGSILELERAGNSWRNRLGEAVDVEAEMLWPLLKGGDLHRGEGPERALLLPQTTLSEPPDQHLADAPRALAYLDSHRGRFEARKSRIYRSRPPFSVFGLGPYSFSPWKVAVSGLHGSLAFRAVGPRGGRPVLFDDTCYLLPMASEQAAHRTADWLNTELVQRALRARSFPGAKRPVTARLLRRLAVAAASTDG